MDVLRRWSLERYERAVLFLLVFSIPLQARIFLFGPTSPEAAAKGALFQEWLSGFFYATDVLVFLLLLIWGIRIARSQVRVSLDTVTVAAFLIAAGAGLTALWALDPAVAGFRSIKFLEGALLFWYVRSIRPSFPLVAWAFALSAALQSVVAWVQFVLQRSIGLEKLAESPISPLRTEVAEIVVSSGRYIRAYGTMPSPNILAFFLVVAILFALRGHILFFSNKLIRVGVPAALFLFACALALTFSRGMLLLGAGASIAYAAPVAIVQRHTRAAALAALFVVLSVGALFARDMTDRFLVSTKYDFAVSERLELNDSALYGIERAPWGVGAGNFTAIHPSLDKPVHNIYLLAAIESGVWVGVLLFLLVAWGVMSHAIALKRRGFYEENFFWLGIGGMLLFAGALDHFFITLQQGMLLFWLLLGLVYNASDTSSHRAARAKKP